MSSTTYHIVLIILGSIMILSLIIAEFIILHEINKIRSCKPPLIAAFFAIILVILVVIKVLSNIWTL